MTRSILFLTEEFGTGHTKAAEALMQSITHLEPSIRMRIIEPGKLMHPSATSFFLRTYRKIIMNYPHLWKMIYHRTSKRQVLQLMIYQLFHRNMDQMLHHLQPDLIICTHPFSSSSLARIKRLSGHDIPICSVITDLHVHQVWVQHEIDLYIVSHDEVSRQLMRYGVSQDRIAVTGMPVRMNFWQKNNKIESREKLQLHNLPTVIIMGGGWGIGKLKQIAYSLLKWKDTIQLLICTGTNDQLRTSLLKKKYFQHPNITITGYVERIDRWFDAADLIITKPGGITIFEALTKGVPLLLYCDHFVSSKLAIKVNHIRDMDEWIEKLLFTPNIYEPWLARIKQFQESLNPYAGAKSVLQLLSSTSNK